MKNLVANLVERRVPQYLLVYIGTAWGLLQFTQFIVGEYLLSPHWIRIAFYAVLMLWPAYLLVVYRHARPGADSWGLVEKIGVPANLLAAVVANRLETLRNDVMTVSADLEALKAIGRVRSRSVRRISAPTPPTR